MRTVVAIVVLLILFAVVKAAVTQRPVPTVHMTPAQCAEWVARGHDQAEC